MRYGHGKKDLVESFLCRWGRCYGCPDATWRWISEAFSKEFEKLVCLAYSSSSGKIQTLREARYFLFKKHLGDTAKLPSSECVLEQHMLRSHHQCKIWKKSYLSIQKNDCPTEFGWKMENGQYMHVATKGPVTPEFVLAKLYCQCKGKCESKRCACVKESRSYDGCNCFELCEITGVYTLRECQWR